MNKTKSIVAIGLLAGLSLASCNSGNMRRNPGKTYAPDMTYSRAYDAYSAFSDTTIFPDGLASRKPVPGTIAIGHELPDHLTEGDTNAYKTFTTHLRFDKSQLDEGKRLYNIYCGICHGTALDGNGPLYNGGAGKFPAKPADFTGGQYLHMPVGQMYAAVKYGKNMMGSYASQLDIKQRWMVIAYIKSVQAGKGGDVFTLGAGAPVADTAHAVAMADTAKH